MLNFSPKTLPIKKRRMREKKKKERKGLEVLLCSRIKKLEFHSYLSCGKTDGIKKYFRLEKCAVRGNTAGLPAGKYLDLCL